MEKPTIEQLKSLAPEALESIDAETRFLTLALPHLETIPKLEFVTVISADKEDGVDMLRDERLRKVLNRIIYCSIELFLYTN